MNYKNKKWKQLRLRVLSRNDFKCQECIRTGTKKEATVAHHIYPAEVYPELKYNSYNLYSCCESCHNKFHDRITNKLTAAGIDLARRKRSEIEKTLLSPLPLEL